MAFKNFFFTSGSGRVVSNQPLNVEVVSEPMDTRGLKDLTFYFDLTRGGGLTNVVMKLEGSHNKTDWMPIQNQTGTPPNKNLTDATWTKTTSTNAVWSFNVSEGSESVHYPFMRMRLTGANATVDDIISVDAYGES